jgi:hypothetical protein
MRLSSTGIPQYRPVYINTSPVKELKRRVHYIHADQHLPEHALYSAILERAVMDVVYEKGPIKDSALTWFRGAGGTVTFDECCAILSIEESYIRKLLSEHGVRV